MANLTISKFNYTYLCKIDFNNDISRWLPITKKHVEARGWEELDVIIISGDAYVDHPAFGSAVIGRIIESEGLRVAIVPQPNWQDDLRDFKKFGKPKLFFGVTSGCMDSMVNHYTAARRKRSTDAYTPGGNSGHRPDYAVTVYTNILKDLYPDVPVLIGGIEASLRRVTHYDYWSNKLYPTILEDSKADMLVYGMGEMPLRQITRRMLAGEKISEIRDVLQTAYLEKEEKDIPEYDRESIYLASHETCLRNKKLFAANFKHIEKESNKVQANRLIQKVKGKYLVVNPPYPPMTENEIDTSFDLPYTRMPHPKYAKRGSIPAYEMIRFSVNMHRGCFGGCSFCTISAHQGKFIASRSEESILKEVENITKMPDFKGYISDLGGPSGNMYKMKGKVQSICDRCVAPSCIHPVICSNLDTSHKPMTEIYKKVDANPKVKKAFVSSGLRYDLLTESYNKNHDGSLDEYLEQVVCNHVSGRLKVAPEHSSENTLRVMRKPSFKHFREFKKKFDFYNRKHGLKQPLIPYFISSHPGCEEEDMANLAADTKELGFRLEQVQDFTPTPMTVATIIYYTGLHPYTLKEVYTAKNQKEKKAQHQFFFWYKGENRKQIRARLEKMGREDLIEKILGEHRKQNKKEYLKSKVRAKSKSKFKSKKRRK